MTIARILILLNLAVISALSVPGTGVDLRSSMTGEPLTFLQEYFLEAVMPKKSKRPRQSFSTEFKQAAVDLVVKPRYSFKAGNCRWCCREESQR